MSVHLPPCLRSPLQFVVNGDWKTAFGIYVQKNSTTVVLVGELKRKGNGEWHLNNVLKNLEGPPNRYDFGTLDDDQMRTLAETVHKIWHQSKDFTDQVQLLIHEVMACERRDGNPSDNLFIGNLLTHLYLANSQHCPPHKSSSRLGKRNRI